MKQHDRTTSRAFTIIELLVVISLIGIVLGLAVPTLEALQRTGRGEAAVTSVSIATNAARIYNVRLKQSDLGTSGPNTPNQAQYSGTAALFTPSGRIRLTINEQFARDTNGNWLEDQTPPLNGYADIEGIDYVTIPSSAGVVGVQRTNSGSTDLRIIPPPFAIRFNESGHIATDEAFIYYSDEGPHSDYNINDDRPGTYDPDAWDWRINDVSQVQSGEYQGKYRLPFEKIETVNAVIVFNMREFRVTHTGPDPYSDAQWFLENGAAINFSPLSGLKITQE